ncbi:MAG: PLP-dependent transferase, partial [Gammaproteobacteria bacterium]|nr:PLP-dependent transferase [Gammaproteobacteria bacterium]
MATGKFETRLIHGGDSEPAAGAGVAPGIELSTTYVRADPRDTQEFTYGRSDNPNRRTLERRLASIENAFDAAAFASGSAAAMALFQTLPAGSHIIVTRDAYYGVIMLLNDLVIKMGHEVTPVDTSLPANVENCWQKNTRLVWLETPSNPQMRIADVAAIAQLTHRNGAVLCCDNTMATIVLQDPLALGADFTMHSSTKFIGGHSDITGGVIIAREDSEQFQRLREIQALAGSTPSPFDCWLLLRSLATLGLRVQQ